jgi:hypothetical protein
VEKGKSSDDEEKADDAQERRSSGCLSREHERGMSDLTAYCGVAAPALRSKSYLMVHAENASKLQVSSIKINKKIKIKMSCFVVLPSTTSSPSTLLSFESDHLVSLLPSGIDPWVLASASFVQSSVVDGYLLQYLASTGYECRIVAKYQLLQSFSPNMFSEKYPGSHI